MGTLSRMLDPRSIAIAGLSADSRKHGRRVLEHLLRLDYSGEIVGVNPGLPSIEGISVFRSVADVPEPPDLVVAAVPAQALLDVVRDSSGVGGVVAFAGGFGEAGSDGRARQVEIAEVAADTGVRLLGPNSGGIIRPSRGLAASFLTCLDRPAGEIRPGDVGVVTQSGGTGSYLHNIASAQGGGLAVSFSTGNECDIKLGEAIDEVSHLEEVKVVLAIIETVRDGPRFIDAVLSSHARGKRIVVCRIGTGRKGRSLMASHTGALAVPEAVLAGVLDALGVVIGETPAEALEIANILAQAAQVGGPRAAIVTHSGGAAIHLADLGEKSGLHLPGLSAGLKRDIAPFLDHGSASNPLDMGGIIGGPSRFADAVGVVADSDEFDVVLAVSTAHPPAHTPERVKSLLGVAIRVPVVHLWMSGDQAQGGLKSLREHRSPVTEEPRAAIRALVALAQQPLRSLPSPPGLTGAIEEWGLPLVTEELVTTSGEAVDAAGRVGHPVVLKVEAPELDHKTDVGGVHVDLRTAAEVVRAFDEVTEAAKASGYDPLGARVQPFRPGLELIVGGFMDPVFGPVISVGLGGILTEVISEIAFAPAPVGQSEALALIERFAGRRLLDGYRGRPPADVSDLARVLSVVSRGLVGTGVAEVEINPLIWDGREWVAVDWLVKPPSPD